MFMVFGLALIALALSAMVIVKAKKNKELGTGGVKFFGYIVGILAIIMLLFSGCITTMHMYGSACKKAPAHMKYVKKMMKR